MKNSLVLEGVCKTADDGSVILKNVDLHLTQGSKLSVLGPSGSGKTTLLRVIAGLETPDTGHVFFNDCLMDSCPVHKRNFGMMFQDYALFPHMNVYNNIAFGLKMKGMDKRAIRDRVREMLLLTGLEKFEKRHVDDLSGGERQRVALARTLAPKPALLMLDEPLSSLDRILRKNLLIELTNIISQLKIITIFVTHDHKEAFAAGNTLIVMNQGEIVQKGTPSSLIRHPKNQWVKSFLGL